MLTVGSNIIPSSSELLDSVPSCNKHENYRRAPSRCRKFSLNNIMIKLSESNVNLGMYVNEIPVNLAG